MANSNILISRGTSLPLSCINMSDGRFGRTSPGNKCLPLVQIRSFNLVNGIFHLAATIRYLGGGLEFLPGHFYLFHKGD